MAVQFLIVGRVRRPLGLQGKLEVDCLTDFSHRFHPGQKIYLSPSVSNLPELTIEQSQSKKERVVLQFTEINNRTDIEKIVGSLLQVKIEEAEKLPADTYWHHQIIGLKVMNTGGEILGIIKEIIRTGSNDVYVVCGQDKEVLIPATKEVVKAVDLKKGLMMVKLLPGL